MKKFLNDWGMTLLVVFLVIVIVGKESATKSRVTLKAGEEGTFTLAPGEVLTITMKEPPSGMEGVLLWTTDGEVIAARALTREQVEAVHNEGTWKSCK